MNSLFPHHPKRSCRRALGTLLLALPLSGIAFQLPSAQAQPALIQPAKKSPLSPEQKATVNKLLAVLQQARVCKLPIDLKVENATLEEVTNRIKTMLPSQAITIEVRSAKPVQMGFDLKSTRVGDVLDHVAALAGCRLFVLSDRLLIAPSSLLTEAELRDIRQKRGGEWAKSTESGASGWSAKIQATELFTRAVAQEATGSTAKPLPPGVMKTTFGSFSPDSQAMLQEMASWSSGGVGQPTPDAPPFHLSAESPVSVDTSKPNTIDITFSRGISDPAGPMTSGVTVITVPWRPNP